MTRKNTTTPEQRKAEREALLARLGEKVAALASSDEWIAYLHFMQAFRRYSFNNLISIAAQRPNATYGMSPGTGSGRIGAAGPQG